MGKASDKRYNDRCDYGSRPIGDQDEDRIPVKRPLVTMVKMTEGDFESYGTQKWLDGKHHVHGDLLAFLKTKAAEAFGAGKDDLAKQLRDDIPKLIGKFFEDTKKYAEEHKKDYPYKLIEIEEPEPE